MLFNFLNLALNYFYVLSSIKELKVDDPFQPEIVIFKHITESIGEILVIIDKFN